jgi:hypothetical protein
MQQNGWLPQHSQPSHPVINEAKDTDGEHCVAKVHGLAQLVNEGLVVC